MAWSDLVGSLHEDLALLVSEAVSLGSHVALEGLGNIYEALDLVDEGPDRVEELGESVVYRADVSFALLELCLEVSDSGSICRSGSHSLSHSSLKCCEVSHHSCDGILVRLVGEGEVGEEPAVVLEGGDVHVHLRCESVEGSLVSLEGKGVLHRLEVHVDGVESSRDGRELALRFREEGFYLSLVDLSGESRIHA